MASHASKRRKLDASNAPAEIVFDDISRADYLTGFHKRKQARIRHAQELAAKKEREEKVKGRALIRKRRREELEAHVQAVNEAVLEANGYNKDEEEEDSEEEAWDGIVEDQGPRLNREDEYVDEEKYTTVTVEEVGISKDGLVTLEDESEDDENGVKGRISKSSKDPVPSPSDASAKKPGKAKASKVKKKKRNFRYENKAERNVVRMKERSKNSAHAMARKRKK